VGAWLPVGSSVDQRRMRVEGGRQDSRGRRFRLLCSARRGPLVVYMATRIVVHASSSELLDTIERQPNADSVRTNHALGFVFARSLLPATSREPARTSNADKPDEYAEVLVTAWRGDTLA